MAHVRKQIRDTFAGLLDGGTNWNYVYEQRVELKRGNYPYLLVYVDSETSDPETLNSPFQLYRDMNLVVRGFVKSQDEEYLEDKMDLIASEIETAITKQALNAALITATYRPVVSVYLSGTDTEFEYNTDDIEHAVISMGFVIRYQTVEGSPDA